jgi:hypothetical protein
MFFQDEIEKSGLLGIQPDYLGIWEDAPNERVPLARSDNMNNWSARVLRKHLNLKGNARLLTSKMAMLSVRLNN